MSSSILFGYCAFYWKAFFMPPALIAAAVITTHTQSAYIFMPFMCFIPFIGGWSSFVSFDGADCGGGTLDDATS